MTDLLGVAALVAAHAVFVVRVSCWADGPSDRRAAWRAHRRAVRARERAERTAARRAGRR